MVFLRKVTGEYGEGSGLRAEFWGTVRLLIQASLTIRRNMVRKKLKRGKGRRYFRKKGGEIYNKSLVKKKIDSTQQKRGEVLQMAKTI